MTPVREVRGVSGCGARCGCGGKSKLHLRGQREVTPATSTFLCAECVEKAVAMFFARRPEQPPYWPGDEARDEPYQPPEVDGVPRAMSTVCASGSRRACERPEQED